MVATPEGLCVFVCSELIYNLILFRRLIHYFRLKAFILIYFIKNIVINSFSTSIQV